jgi:hypothetical protein
MERKVVTVCAVVGFLGLLSAALAFAAEATRVKVRAPQLFLSYTFPNSLIFIP